MHEGQHHVDRDQVRALVDEQFPQWRGDEVSPVASDGTVNVLFRIGDHAVARFPLQGDDPVQVGHWLADEAAASAELGRMITLDTPRPLGLGRPGHGYPLPWAVQTWVEGEVLTTAELDGSSELARGLAHLVRELRAAPTRGRRFTGAGRGGELVAHDAWMETCFTHSEGLVDVAALRSLWTTLRTLPRAAADVMSHGDLMPGNLLARSGRLAGLIDGGGFGPADPALDLVGAWHLLEHEPRAVLRRGLVCGDLEWARGQAWALEQSMGLVWYYRTSNPAMASIGARTLARILEEPAF